MKHLFKAGLLLAILLIMNGCGTDSSEVRSNGTSDIQSAVDDQARQIKKMSSDIAAIKNKLDITTTKQDTTTSTDTTTKNDDITDPGKLKGDVMKVSGDKITISLGYKHGVTPGDIFDVREDGKWIGRIQIKSVDSYSSEGKVINKKDSKKISEEDTVEIQQ